MEVRFEGASVPDDAIIGLLYQAFKNDYPELTALTLASIPSEIRAQESFAHTPLYQLAGPHGRIVISHRSVATSLAAPYVGWDVFRARILSVFSGVSQSGTFVGAKRFGLRYINFWNDNLVPLLKIAVTHTDYPIEPQDTYLRIRTAQGIYTVQLIVANSAELGGERGTLIDIDVSSSDLAPDLLTNDSFAAVVDHAHALEKSAFFSILHPELLAKLEPEY